MTLEEIYGRLRPFMLLQLLGLLMVPAFSGVALWLSSVMLG